MLESVNQNPALKKDKIEQLIKDLPDRMFLTQLDGDDISNYLNYTTKEEMPIDISKSEARITLDTIQE